MSCKCSGNPIYLATKCKKDFRCNNIIQYVAMEMLKYFFMYDTTFRVITLSYTPTIIVNTILVFVSLVR